jgi:plasmid stabilization system protein ParE
MPQYTISPKAISDLEEIINYFTESRIEKIEKISNEIYFLMLFLY